MNADNPEPKSKSHGWVRVEFSNGKTVVGLGRESVIAGQSFFTIEELTFEGTVMAAEHYNATKIESIHPTTKEEAYAMVTMDVKVFDYVKKAVGDVFGVTVEELNGSGRPDGLVRARHVAFRLLRDKGFTFEEIGASFGGRDHGTVLCGLSSLEDRLKMEPKTFLALKQLRQRLGLRDQNWSAVPNAEAA